MRKLTQACLRTTPQLLKQKPQSGFSSSKIQIPKKVGLLGYGAIGKAFVEILLKQYPEAQIVAVDTYDLGYKENRFQYINNPVNKDNIKDLFKTMGLQEGDFLVDLSTNVEFLELWPLCQNKGIKYLNTALEVWEGSEGSFSYPKTPAECYQTSLGILRDDAVKHPVYNPNKGVTSLLEMGMNPGLISHCVKQGIEDAARFYLKDSKATDLDKVALEKWLAVKNHSKLAQVLGVHTIHCSETDNQLLAEHPKDMTTKMYNTWSCRGFLTEGMIPIQVARGSHEDKDFKGKFCVVRNDSTIMSFSPSVKFWAKTWLPNQEVKGALIPHGEAYSIREYLQDKETGYAPSQYYVYDFPTYAKIFVMNLPKTATVQTVKPVMEVIHPMRHPSLRGVDKVGALMIMKNNRGWWTGSVMDDVDCRDIFKHKFGPTVLQVAAGAWAGFLWACKNPNKGTRFPENTDTDFILKQAKPYLGRWVSTGVDLSKTWLKDCHKLQSFLTEAPEMPKLK